MSCSRRRIARAYFETYGGSREDLAAIAVKNHAHAIGNEHAQYQKEITAEDAAFSFDTLMEKGHPRYKLKPGADPATLSFDSLRHAEVAQRLHRGADLGRREVAGHEDGRMAVRIDPHREAFGYHPLMQMLLAGVAVAVWQLREIRSRDTVIRMVTHFDVTADDIDATVDQVRRVLKNGF